MTLLSAAMRRRVRLAKRQREVTVLVGGLNQSYDRAGRRLGISPKTVRWYAREVTRAVGSDRPPREALARVFIDRFDELGPLVQELSDAG